MSIRAVVGAVVAIAAAFALVACGDSDDDSDQKLSLRPSSGDGKAAKFTAPKAAEAGEAEIAFTNETKDEADCS